MKLKEKFYNLYEVIKKAIKKFPITIISIFILTVILTICVGNRNVDWNLIGKIAMLIIIFSSSTYLIETLAKSKKKNFIFYVLALILSSVLTILLFTKNNVLGINNELFVHLIARITGCYIISLVLLSLYYNYKKTEKTFQSYITDVAINIYKIDLIYAILALGTAIITSIFIFLILNGKGYILIARIEILLLGLYYIPTIIYTFFTQESEKSKFAKNVIKYVLGTLVMIAFAIIYIYLLKIIILRNIPSNQIFRIISALFIIGLPIWTMCSSLEEGNTFDKINKKLPMFFVPFIFLQMYSIGVRIATYGMTEARYLCIMLIIFEIIYTIIYLKNKSKIGNIFIVLIAITIVSTIMPYINMFKASAMSQYNILKKYNEKDNITQEEKSKLRGAYYYLENSEIGKKYLENYSVDMKKINDFPLADTSIYGYDGENINAESKSEYIDVEGYKKLYNIKANSYYKDNNYTIDNIFEKTTFRINGDNNKVDINIQELIRRCIIYKNSLDEKFSDINELIINENRKVVINSIYIYYNKSTNIVSSYNISGYLLEK